MMVPMRATEQATRAMADPAMKRIAVLPVMSASHSPCVVTLERPEERINQEKTPQKFRLVGQQSLSSFEKFERILDHTGRRQCSCRSLSSRELFR